MPSLPLNRTRSDDVGHGVTLSLLNFTHKRTCKAWHEIIAFGKHTRSEDVERGIQSRPLENTHGRMI